MSAPILLTVYNRLEHLKQCIEYLSCCGGADKSELYISSDAAYRVEDELAINDVRAYIKTISGFLKVIPIFHEGNRGLKESYYTSLELIFKKYDRFIFLEDDVVVAPDFLSYMNEALIFYQDDFRIFSISAFSFSTFYRVAREKQNRVYFTNRFYPWGFGQWKSRALLSTEYTKTDVEESLNDSGFLNRLNANGQDLQSAFLSLMAQKKMLVLDYLHTYHMVRNNLFTVVPYMTKSFNIGHDGSGSRTVKNSRFQKMDLNFLHTPNSYNLTPLTKGSVDNSFNRVHFSSPLNRIKLFLRKLGLLGVVMKWVNQYRGKQ